MVKEGAEKKEAHSPRKPEGAKGLDSNGDGKSAIGKADGFKQLATGLSVVGSRGRISARRVPRVGNAGRDKVPAARQDAKQVTGGGAGGLLRR